MNTHLYLVERPAKSVGYDEYISVVAAAPDEDTARWLFENLHYAGYKVGPIGNLSVTCIGSYHCSETELVHKSYRAG